MCRIRARNRAEVKEARCLPRPEDSSAREAWIHALFFIPRFPSVSSPCPWHRRDSSGRRLATSHGDRQDIPARHLHGWLVARSVRSKKNREHRNKSLRFRLPSLRLQTLLVLSIRRYAAARFHHFLYRYIDFTLEKSLPSAERTQLVFSTV